MMCFKEIITQVELCLSLAVNNLFGKISTKKYKVGTRETGHLFILRPLKIFNITTLKCLLN